MEQNQLKNTKKNIVKFIKKKILNIIDFFNPENLFEINKYEFNRITINKSVSLDIMDFAKNSHPKEFIAFLQGEVKDEKLIIKRLLYHKHLATEKSALFKMNQPTGMNIVGTVHSHPSRNNKPSQQDLNMYNKFGGLHMIISYPYSLENINTYDYNGNKLNIEILVE